MRHPVALWPVMVDAPAVLDCSPYTKWRTGGDTITWLAATWSWDELINREGIAQGVCRLQCELERVTRRGYDALAAVGNCRSRWR